MSAITTDPASLQTGEQVQLATGGTMDPARMTPVEAALNLLRWIDRMGSAAHGAELAANGLAQTQYRASEGDSRTFTGATIEQLYEKFGRPGSPFHNPALLTPLYAANVRRANLGNLWCALADLWDGARLTLADLPDGLTGRYDGDYEKINGAWQRTTAWTTTAPWRASGEQLMRQSAANLGTLRQPTMQRGILEMLQSRGYRLSAAPQNGMGNPLIVGAIIVAVLLSAAAVDTLAFRGVGYRSMCMWLYGESYALAEAARAAQDAAEAARRACESQNPSERAACLRASAVEYQTTMERIAGRAGRGALARMSGTIAKVAVAGVVVLGVVTYLRLRFATGRLRRSRYQRGF